jgi:hypothetical protein
MCATNCALNSADYSGTYGITTSSDALALGFVTSSNIGWHVYMMASKTKYKTFNLLNKELTMDVDMSKLPCSLNGVMYFLTMSTNSGTSSTNTAGVVRQDRTFQGQALALGCFTCPSRCQHSRVAPRPVHDLPIYLCLRLYHCLPDDSLLQDSEIKLLKMNVSMLLTSLCMAF